MTIGRKTEMMEENLFAVSSLSPQIPQEPPWD
jgi:hypothetical protein